MAGGEADIWVCGDCRSVNNLRAKQCYNCRTPSGPRVHLRVESPKSMIATLDGQSEAISLSELKAAAGALARADGSAAIVTTTNVETRAMAQQALGVLSGAQVPTTLEESQGTNG